MIPHRNSPLSIWVSELLGSGRCVFTSDEAIQELGIGRGSFLDAAERLQRKGHLFSPKRGFYVIVPPRFFSWGAPPPNHYIDDLMGFKYCPYYVGLLKAAALHGATHQAVMEFQVMAGKRISKIHAGRSIIAFYFSKNISDVTRGIQLRKTPTGSMKISSPELTALDLVRYPNGTAGSDNLATVLKDLGPSLNAQKLAELSKSFERTVTQRLGYLLDYLGYENQTAPLHREISSSQFNWVELTPLRSPYADLLIPPVERDKKWRIIVRFHPDPDF